MNKPSNGIKDFFAKTFYLEQWKRNKNKKPSKKQWFSFFKIISKTEKNIFLVLFLLAIGSSLLWWWLSVLENTKIQPAEGGILKEVIMGQPQSLNPLFSLLNDADRDVSELIFSGLLKYSKDGKLINDLAKEYNLSKDGKVYEFKLKDDLLWSDEKKITAGDIIFTIETLKNPETQSPLRLIWQDVKTEKIDEQTIKFTLKNAYSPFLENFTLKILPAHTFEDVNPQELFSKPQEKIVSSGSLKIKSIEKGEEERIKKIIFDKNPNFYGKALFLNEIELIFARDEMEFSELKNQATNIPNVSAKDKNNLEENFKTYPLSLPRYFALFLNQENKILSIKEVRESLAMATPKEEIINQVLSGEGRIIEGPLLEENNVGGKSKKYEFNIEEAKKKLDKAGWKDGNKDGTREKILKKGEKATLLELNLFTVDQKELKETAEIIQKKWKEIGVKLNINAIEGEKLRQDNITERNYDILLFAQGLYMIADPSSFWHSSQRNYPGSNLSMYQNSEVDEILKKSIAEIDFEKRKKLLQAFQQKLTEDIPAIFLYSPNYLYAADKKIKGIDGKYIIDPSKRFIGIENWYIKEKRMPK